MLRGIGIAMTQPSWNNTTVDDAWYATAFGALYPVVYAHRTIEAAAPEAAFAADQLCIHPSHSVLDLCCGNGRHMSHLIERAKRVVGLDYSAELLDLAQQHLGASGALVRGDMRALPFVDAFDAVFSFFTSFGYFLEPEENRAAAHCMVRALRKNGRLFMDYLNAPHVEATLVPHSQREHEGFIIVEDRWIDASARRVNKRTAVCREGRVVFAGEESVCLYTPEELCALLRVAGLEIDRVFGDYEGNALDAARPRMLIVGHRIR